MIIEPKDWETFEKDKHYRFSARVYLLWHLRHPDLKLEDAIQAASTPWVKALDGQTIVLDETTEQLCEALNYREGTIGRIQWFAIPKMWCEEVNIAP